jgi:3-oxoacyl-[acyl-carrier protein] reductase
MESRRSSESRVVLVTGGSRGLGRAIAVGFGSIGACVVVNYRTNADEANRTVKAVGDAGGSAFAYQADVRDAKNVAAMVSAAVDRWHRLDVLVCNAAASEDSLLLRLPDEAWDRVLATTLTGVFLCLQSAGAVMQAQGHGAVILVGSLAGLQGQGGQAPYASAKAGLLGLMRTAAREWGAHDVRVNLVLPGWHATALTGFRDDMAPHPFKTVLGHGTSMDAVASFVVSLAAMPDVSGQVFTLDSRITPP